MHKKYAPVTGITITKNSNMLFSPHQNNMHIAYGVYIIYEKLFFLDPHIYMIYFHV